MSALGFDPRPYCERLAKACPERFRVGIHQVLRGDHRGYVPEWICSEWERPSAVYVSASAAEWRYWAFFGPLADERRVTAIEGTKGLSLDLLAWRRSTLLESIIVAVVESFESQNECEATL